MARANSTGRRGSERGDSVHLGGAVPVAGDVSARHVEHCDYDNCVSRLSRGGWVRLKTAWREGVEEGVPNAC